MVRLVAFSLLLLSAAAHAHPGLHPGEGFTYRLSVGPIEGARARMSIGMPVQRDGHALVAVQGEAETVSIVSLVAPVNAAYQLVLDADTLLPREVTTIERGMHERRFHSRIDGRTLDLEIVAPQRNGTQHRTLPRETRDPLSAYFALRTFPLADKNQIELDVIDGAALWRVHLRVIGREQIRLNEESNAPTPKLRAIRIEGTLERIDDLGHAAPRVPQRTLVCWLSDDPSRTLLRASFDSTMGRAHLELTSYLPPAAKSASKTSANPAVGASRARSQNLGPLPGIRLD